MQPPYLFEKCRLVVTQSAWVCCCDCVPFDYVAGSLTVNSGSIEKAHELPRSNSDKGMEMEKYAIKPYVCMV